MSTNDLYAKYIREPLIIIDLSLPRRRESSDVKGFWIPAPRSRTSRTSFAGMTFLLYSPIHKSFTKPQITFTIDAELVSGHCPEG